MSEEHYYWAKTLADGSPGCTVRQHCCAAAEVARRLLAQWPDFLRRLLPPGAVTLVACHDVGKISPGFQTKCAAWTGPDGQASPRELRHWSHCNGSHAASSHWLLRNYYQQARHERCWRTWAECALHHHGSHQDAPGADEASMPQAWVEDAFALIRFLESQYGRLPEADRKAPEDVTRLLTGLMIVADWIASDEECFPVETGAWDAAACADSALRRIGFDRGAAMLPGLAWGSLFPHAPQPRPVQRYLWEHAAEQGVYVIEDAMGGGKTEAALGLAYHLIEQGRAQGIYFALPTQTTSNRIFFRVRDFASRAGVAVGSQNMNLAHGQSWLLREVLFEGVPQAGCRGRRPAPTPEEAEEGVLLDRWFASSKRSLLTRYGVGTIDQALMAVLAVKHSYVRAFGLAGKVVILDEVHSYDMYTGTLVTELVRFLKSCGATVIILSATLTQQRLLELLGAKEEEPVDLSAYPLVSSCTARGGVQSRAFSAEAAERSVHVRCSASPLPELAAEACAHAAAGQCVLWIRNTVKEAQETYRLLQAERCEGGPEMGVLHARFPYWRREEAEESWIGRLGRDGAARPRGCVLVATQVVEQSIDIDADYLMTDLAPTDMLLQRMGRLWRHERPLAQRCAERAEMHVCLPLGWESAVQQKLEPHEFCRAVGPSAYVYAPYVLLRSWEVWRDRNEVCLPGDIRRLIEATYAEREPLWPSEEALAADLEKKKQQMRDLALLNSSSGTGTIPDEEEISTRYGSQRSSQVLLLRCKPEVLGAESVRYCPLHGEPLVLNPLRWEFAKAKALAENVVKVPAAWVSKAVPDENWGIYSSQPIFSYFALDGNRYSCYKQDIETLRWSASLGAEPAETQPCVEDGF